MQLSISTNSLQDMVSKVIHCASNNKLIPITSLMSIKVSNNILTLTTTDATNYYYVNSTEKVDCEDFEVSVIADTFSKLVQKTTSEKITISVNENILEVKGNGNYKLELPLDDGAPIKFVNKLPDTEPKPTDTIKKTFVDKVLQYNKPSLAISVEVPSVCNYHCGETVISTDSCRICSTGIKMFNSDVLISPQVMDLLGVFSEEDICVYRTDSYILFWDTNDSLYAPIVPGVNEFPVGVLTDFINGDFPSRCTVNRASILELLDRLSLFVSSYDHKAIALTFTKEGIMFSSKKSSGVELIPYIKSEDFKDYACEVDIELLKSQVATQDSETLDVYYGSDAAIKMVSGNIVMLLSLILEDENGEE